MSTRDQELVQWFREELKVSQVELREILSLTESQLYAGVRRECDYFQAYEMIKLLAFWNGRDQIKGFLLRKKLQRDFWDLDLSEIEEAVTCVA